MNFSWYSVSHIIQDATCRHTLYFFKVWASAINDEPILKGRSFETSNLIIGRIFMLFSIYYHIIPVQAILLSYNTLAFCILMEIVTEFKDLMK